MVLIQLGSITLQGFEVPGRISFGGAQQLAVHKLIGGVRVVDALGRDDGPLKWSGVLSGSDAASRARSLDDVRVAGQAQTLTWDAFCYSVIIAKLNLDFCNPWWIPYKITCLVQRDLAQTTAISPPSTLASVVSDLSSAQQFLPPDLAAQVASASSMLASPTSSSAVADTLEKVRLAIDGGAQIAELGLRSGDISQVVTQAGLLAQFCCAKGFLNRSAANLTMAGV